jgi:hypothetical protein
MNKQIRTTIFNFSGLLVLSGTILYLTKWIYAPYLFAFGAAGIAFTYLTSPYQILDFRRRRLHRFNIIAGILMLVASAFMFKNRTEWILCLSIAAFLQAYTAFVTPKEK